MDLQNIIIIIAAIVVVLILLRILTKVIFKILVFVAVLAGLIIYFLFFDSRSMQMSRDPEELLIEMQDKYCTDTMDSVKCECIILPLLTDLSSNYSSEQIIEMRDDPVKATKVVFKLLRDNKADIKVCLEKHNAEFNLKDFIDDIRSLAADNDVEEASDSK